MRELDETVLTADQAEALRLADLEGLYQEAAARRMGVSRQTFGRILSDAHRILADAVLNRKALRLEGGHIILKEKDSMQTRIAVPTRDGEIDAHFGHCEYFSVYEVADGLVLSESVIESPEGCGCKSDIASILARNGVTVMLAGGMGDGAVRVLNGHGIAVVRGASGPARDVLENWLSGSVADSGESCREHHGTCDH